MDSSFWFDSVHIDLVISLFFKREKTVNLLGSCSGQNLILSRWWYVPLQPRIFSKKSTTLRVQHGASVTSNFLKVSFCHIQLSSSQHLSHPAFSKSASVTSDLSEIILHPKDLPTRSRLPPLQGLYLPDVFLISKVSNPKSEAPNISPLIFVYRYCHAPLPKIQRNRVVKRVGDVYTWGEYPTYTR